MAREIVVTVWCDLCQDLDDIKVEGEELPAIAVGNQKPRVLAMCKEHRANFFEPFVEALTNLGVFADQIGAGAPKQRKKGSSGDTAPGTKPAETSTGARIMCPAPGCGEDLKNPSSTASHLRSQHKMSLFDAIGVDGVLYDVNGVAIETPKIRRREPDVKRVECDVPGCDHGPDGGPTVYAFPENRMPAQALAVHKAKTHGIRSTGKKKTASGTRRKNADQEQLAGV